MTAGATPLRDRLPAELRIDRQLLTHLSRPAPMCLLLCACFEWALIAGAIMLALRLDTLWATVAAVALIGTRQHALLMLMHEFSHRQFSRTSSGLNDALGDLLTAIPFFITIHGFRRNHLAHHLAPATTHDPNWVSSTRLDRYCFPKSRWRMTGLVAMHCLGVFAIQDAKGYLFEAGMAIGTPPATRLRQAILALWVVGAASMFQLSCPC